MSSKYQYEQINAVGEVANEAASLQLLTARSGTGCYVYIEKITVSVFKAASGGGGLLKILDSDGTSIFTINADGVKDFTLNFGGEGYNIGANKGIQAVVSGGAAEQASASVSIVGHHSFQSI